MSFEEMGNQRLGKGGLTESNGIDLKTDEIAEHQKMTKTEMEKKMTRILKLMKNKDQGKSRAPMDSKKETEVVGLVEDLYKNYQLIYEQYGHLRGEAKRIVNSRKKKEEDNEDDSSSSSSSSSDSDSELEYFSSEEASTTNIHVNSQNEEQSSNLQVQIQVSELEKQIAQKNEALAKVESLHCDLDSVRNQKRELEDEKNHEISENMILIRNLKEELANKIEVEQKMLEEKERDQARIKDLETEIDTLHHRRRETEEQITRIRSENQRLNTKNSEMETEASSQTIALMEQIKNQKHTIDASQDENIKLGQEIDRSKQEITEIEAENNKLRIKIEEQERIINEKNETIDKHNEASSYIPDADTSLVDTERKMEELAEDLRSGLEDKIRLLSQRILDTEQLHITSRESYRSRNKRYEQEKHEADLMKVCNRNECEMDRMARNFEEESSKLQSHILWITKEVAFAKYWVRTRNGELRQLKANLSRFIAEMEEKEEHEFLLREKLWKLEAKMSKEGGEKLNLIRTLGQFQRKMMKMESILKEKDEEVFRVAEEKREVIRQLCVVIDHHRCRYDLLKDAMIGKNVRNRSNKC